MADVMPLGNFLPLCFALGLGTGFLGGLLGIGGGMVQGPLPVKLHGMYCGDHLCVNAWGAISAHDSTCIGRWAT